MTKIHSCLSMFAPNTSRLLLRILVSVIVFAPATISAQSLAMVEFFSSGKRTSGGLLYRSSNYAMALGSDGRLHELEGRNVKRIRKTGKSFAPDSPLHMRAKLQSEYGKNFEVVATKDFLVVQPRGRGRRWPTLFQTSHDAFISYMNKRRVRTNAGNFPMVAVVLPDETAMRNEFRRMKLDVGRVLGVYHPFSNRVLTHDGGRVVQTYATVRHETAHQSGYNSGVHSRINDIPNWITEGVGQMFEPESMAERSQGANRRERINRESLRYLHANHQDRIRFIRDVQSLIRSDELFKGKSTEIADAYSLSWAMMFYLGERDHSKFATILNATSARPPFVEYTASQRQKDFEQWMGVSVEQFAMQVHRFIFAL